MKLSYRCRRNSLPEGANAGSGLDLSTLVEAGLDTSSSSEESEDYADVYQKLRTRISVEWPEDYWKITKLTQYLKKGNPTLTSLALLSINDCNFDNPITMQALKDSNGVNVIINLLRCEAPTVRRAALRCLQNLAQLKILRYEMVYFGGLQEMVNLLWEPEWTLRKEAASIIRKIAVFHRAWRITRNCKGIVLLTNLLYLPKSILNSSGDNLSILEDERLSAAIEATWALCKLCKDKKNKRMFWNIGGLEQCRIILKCNIDDLLIAVINLIQECAAKDYFRIAIRSTEMLGDIRKHLFSENKGLMQTSAQAVFRCAEDYRSREFFGEKGFVDKLCEMISSSEYHSDERLMASITGALWKCSKSMSNVKRLQSLNAVQLVIQLLGSQPLKVQVHIVGCIAECIQVPQICALARKNGAIEALVNLLKTTYPPLIRNVNKAIANASNENESMAIIDKLDAIRLVWSHLQNKDPSVVSNATWKLRTILKNVKELPLYVRTLLGGVELVTKKLLSPYSAVQTPACAVIIALAKDYENIAVLTDFHIVKLLSDLKGTKCKRLRYYLSLAIAECSKFKNNREEFGNRGVVKPLTKFLKSKTLEVKGAACHALFQMSLIPNWCAFIHKTKGVLNNLLDLMDSDDAEVQESAAGTIQHMRYFSLVKDRNIYGLIENRILKDRNFYSQNDHMQQE